MAYCKEFAKLPCNFPNKRKLNARDKLSRYLPHTKDNVSLVMEFLECESKSDRFLSKNKHTVETQKVYLANI